MKRILRAVILLAAMFLLIGIAGAFLRPSTILTKEQAKEKYTLPASHFLTWRGGDVHYVDEGTGMPILMIHGLAGSHRNFGKIAERLKKDYRCIRVDLPGFGLSDMPDAKDDYRKLYIDFFSFFLDTMQLDSFYLMGNSMGGWMSWEIAARYPERVKKLALLCSAGYDMEAVAKRLSLGMGASSDFIEKLSAKGIPSFITKKNIDKCFADASKVSPEEVAAANDLTNREGNFHIILELLRHRKDADTSLIKTIQCPTLIVWGKQDNIIPYQHAYRFQRDVPNNRLIMYEDCGHVPMIEKVEQFEKDFRAFAENTPNS